MGLHRREKHRARQASLTGSIAVVGKLSADGPPRVVRWAACLVLGVWAPACGAKEGDTTASEAGDTTEGSTWLPDVCSPDASPFLQEACLDALRQACNAHDAENDCMAVPSLSFDDGGYAVRCLWAKVVSFSDVSSCAVQSVFGRCEAHVDTECGDFCSGGALLTDVFAIPSRMEIIQMCQGPLGPWSAVGSDSDYLSGCPHDPSPQRDPLCDCANVVCEGG